jgi:hypothetical protein
LKRAAAPRAAAAARTGSKRDSREYAKLKKTIEDKKLREKLELDKDQMS